MGITTSSGLSHNCPHHRLSFMSLVSASTFLSPQANAHSLITWLFCMYSENSTFASVEKNGLWVVVVGSCFLVFFARLYFLVGSSTYCSLLFSLFHFSSSLFFSILALDFSLGSIWFCSTCFFWVLVYVVVPLCSCSSSNFLFFMGVVSCLVGGPGP